MTMFETSALRTVDASRYELGCFSVFVRHPIFLLSSYVCNPLFKRQNSQILRRPQDDNQFWASLANIG